MDTIPINQKEETDNATPAIINSDISRKAFRKNRARLIHKIYQVDPLVCPKCNGKMRIISFIKDEQLIKKILIHLDLWMKNNHDPPTKSKTTACGYSYHEPLYYEEVYTSKYEDEFSQENPYAEF